MLTSTSPAAVRQPMAAQKLESEIYSLCRKGASRQARNDRIIATLLQARTMYVPPAHHLPKITTEHTKSEIKSDSPASLTHGRVAFQFGYEVIHAARGSPGHDISPQRSTGAPTAFAVFRFVAKVDGRRQAGRRERCSRVCVCLVSAVSLAQPRGLQETRLFR